MGCPRLGTSRAVRGKVNSEGRVLTSIQPAVIEHNSQAEWSMKPTRKNRCMKDESENWFSKSLRGEMEIQRSVIEGGTSGVLPAREGTSG